MKSKKYKIYLSPEERQEVEGIINRGKHSAATIKRANILLDLDENTGAVLKQAEIAKRFKTTTTTIYNISKQFVSEGLEATLYRKKRETPPIQPIATGDIEARIIALACSAPPKGRSRWTLRLLEEKVIELQIVEAISDNTIGRLLKKHHLSLT
jgi:transposase